MAKQKKKKKKKSKKVLKKTAWDLLSKIIRLKFSNVDGYCECVTCGTVKYWTELQAGHFIPKARGNSVYFLEENIHPQCVTCNIFRGGNLTSYTLYMIDMYGRDEVDRMNKVSNEKIKITESDYEEMIIDYKKRLKELL